jgi:hypothetical protein
MKKSMITLLLLLAFFSAVSCKSNTVDPDEVSEEEIDLTPSNRNKVYSFDEIDASLGPIAMSLKDIEAKYGEPVSVYGTIISSSSGDLGINADYNDVHFTLVNNHGEKLSKTFEEVSAESQDTANFELKDSDKDVKLKPYTTIVSSSTVPLPRGIKIGNERDSITSAYENDTGEELTEDNVISAKYSYRPQSALSLTDTNELEAATGSIVYEFKDDLLISAKISWYNGYLAFD